jgi:hypothetical protein
MPHARRSPSFKKRKAPAAEPRPMGTRFRLTSMSPDAAVHRVHSAPLTASKLMVRE